MSNPYPPPECLRPESCSFPDCACVEDDEDDNWARNMSPQERAGWIRAMDEGVD